MILVTGASGTVGGALVEQLRAQGETVRVFTRDAAKVAQWGDQVERAVGDLSRPETLDAALQGVERVFLVTASTQQDANVLEAARRAGVRQVVKLSTLEAVDPNMSEHVKWHREREELIRASGLAWTFLRPTMFMSTALDWAQSVRKQGVFRFPGGEGKVAAVDPWDVAAVAATALTKAGHETRAYALTGPQALSFGEMAQVLTTVLGKPVRYEDVPDQMAAEGMRQAGLPEYVISGLNGTFAALRAGRLAFCTDDVEQVTGRKPRTFEAWCQANSAAYS